MVAAGRRRPRVPTFCPHFHVNTGDAESSRRRRDRRRRGPHPLQPTQALTPASLRVAAATTTIIPSSPSNIHGRSQPRLDDVVQIHEQTASRFPLGVEVESSTWSRGIGNRIKARRITFVEVSGAVRGRHTLKSCSPSWLTYPAAHSAWAGRALTRKRRRSIPWPWVPSGWSGVR